MTALSQPGIVLHATKTVIDPESWRKCLEALPETACHADCDWEFQIGDNVKVTFLCAGPSQLSYPLERSWPDVPKPPLVRSLGVPHSAASWLSNAPPDMEAHRHDDSVLFHCRARRDTIVANLRHFADNANLKILVIECDKQRSVYLWKADDGIHFTVASVTAFS